MVKRRDKIREFHLSLPPKLDAFPALGIKGKIVGGPPGTRFNLNDLTGYWRERTYQRALVVTTSADGTINLYRYYQRTIQKIKPYNQHNPQTRIQQANRNRFGRISREWRSLTPAQKKVYNDIGDKENKNGYSVFMRARLKA